MTLFMLWSMDVDHRLPTLIVLHIRRALEERSPSALSVMVAYKIEGESYERVQRRQVQEITIGCETRAS